MLENISVAGEVINISVMRKWKCMFVNGCQCQSSISTATEILNLCQVGTNSSMCLGVMLKNYGGIS